MDIENLITTRPKEADKLAQDWTLFIGKHSEISHFVLKQEFVAWAQTHGNIDTSIWIGKEIRDAYFHIRQKHEEKQIEQTGHVDSHDIPNALAALGFLGTLFSEERPKILEEDPHFKRILEEKAALWLKEHPGKDTTSKEWIDYRYGSLENPEAPTLFSHAEEEFKTKHEVLWKKYSEERKKIYDDPKQDPTLAWHEEEITLHAEARHELLQKTDPSVTIEQVQKQIETVHWEKFAEKHPEKAATYTTKHDGIKEGIARVEEKKRLHQEQLKIAAEKQGIHDLLTAHQQTTGKEIHYVEDKMHRAPDISVEEASKRLGAITPQQKTPPILQRPILPSVGLVNTQGRPIGSIPSISTQRPLQTFVQRPQPQFFPQSPLMSSPVNSGGGMPQPSPTPQPPPPGDRGNPGLGGGMPLTNLAKSVVKRYATLSAIVPITILLISVAVFSLLMGDAITGEASPIGTGGSSNGTGTITGASNISSCQFTRLGISTPLTSSTLANIINAAAQQEGIPAGILASIARHETDLITKPDTDPDIQSGNYCKPGVPFCEYKGTNLHSGECTPADKPGSRTARAMGLMQVVDIYNEGIDTCNIEQNAAAGARTFKAKLGEGSTANENDVKKAICRYFGKDDVVCPYTGTYDYGKEVWNDFQSCQQTQTVNGTGNSSSVSQSGSVPVSQAGKEISNKALLIAKELIYSKPPPDGCVQERGYGPGFHCWNKADMIFFNQANDTDYFQCTEFVWASFYKAGFGKEIDLIRNADAAGWPSNAEKSNGVFTVFYDANQLEPGDIISVGKKNIISDTSHLAIVTYKDPSSSYVVVAQAATDKSYDEKWPIENGKIDSTQFPLAGRETRQEVKGFIRLVKKIQ